MRTRLLVAALLTLGLLFTFSGAVALAEHVPGPDDEDAAAQQYGPDDVDVSDGTGGFDDGVGDGTSGFDDGTGDGDGNGLSAGDQSSADDGIGLANTGLLAIPLLLVGVVMLGAGAFVGVRTRRE